MKKNKFIPRTKEELNKFIEMLKERWYTSPKEYGIRLLYSPIHKKKAYQNKGSRRLVIVKY